MAQIDCLSLVRSLNEKHFNDAKAYLSDYLTFYYVKPSNADPDLIAEKLGQYLEQVERNNAFIRDDDLPCIYAEQLISMIDNCMESDSRADKYLARAKEIKDSLKKSAKPDISNELEDITSIYLCLAQTFNEDRKKKIADFNFDIASVDIKSIMKNIDLDNPYGIKVADMIPDSVKNNVADEANKKLHPLMSGFGAAQKSMSDFVDKLSKDTRKEPVHDVIEGTNKAIYSRHNFMKVILILVYFRLLDLNGLDN
jgi:hypothetical protein